MGVIRGGLLFVICVLLFFSFLAMNLSYTLDSSLSYNHVQAQLIPLVQNITQSGNPLYDKLNLSDINISQVVQQHRSEIESLCVNYPNYSFEFQGYNLSLPCSQIMQGKNISATSLINESVKSFVKEIYYKDYNCGFWNCFGKNGFPFFLVSQQAKDYWTSKFYLSLIISLVLTALMFFVLEKKLNLPIVTGAILILASIPLIKLGSILSGFLGYPFTVLFNIFFSQAPKIFWMSGGIGLLLVAAGISLRFVNSGAITWISSKIDEAASKNKNKSPNKIQNNKNNIKSSSNKKSKTTGKKK